MNGCNLNGERIGKKTLVYYIFQTHKSIVREDRCCQGDLTFKIPLLSAWLWDRDSGSFDPESLSFDCHFLGPFLEQQLILASEKKADSIT